MSVRDMTGHYEMGLRDGGSSWHLGTANRRECPHDSCRWAEKERLDAARLRKVARFCADRLVAVYGESPNADYILTALELSTP